MPSNPAAKHQSKAQFQRTRQRILAHFTFHRIIQNLCINKQKDVTRSHLFKSACAHMPVHTSPPPRQPANPPTLATPSHECSISSSKSHLQPSQCYKDSDSQSESLSTCSSVRHFASLPFCQFVSLSVCQSSSLSTILLPLVKTI